MVSSRVADSSFNWLATFRNSTFVVNQMLSTELAFLEINTPHGSRAGGSRAAGNRTGGSPAAGNRAAGQSAAARAATERTAAGRPAAGWAAAGLYTVRGCVVHGPCLFHRFRILHT